MFVKTAKSFNQFTRHALSEKVSGYVNKTKSQEEDLLRLKKTNNLSKVYRFDLGENVDGFSPMINEFLENLYRNEILFSKLNAYPDITHLSLRERLGAVFNIPRQYIVISAGLDSVLDLITRAFFEYRDTYLMPVPGFFLFESYSERMGASPVFMKLKDDDGFAWTEEAFCRIKDLMARFRPKILWLSNPNNPTGQIIPDNMLVEIFEIAHEYNIYVVVDEAYHDYIGTPAQSSARYLHQFDNLLVLRTFSKAHGLAGIRLGYAMCSNSEIIDALLLHRHHFPITQISMHIARIALKDKDFIAKTRTLNEQRRQYLFQQLKSLESFSYINSATNVFMLQSKTLSATELDKRFRRLGIITSRLNITGLDEDNYLRITIRGSDDNLILFNACKELNDEFQSIY